MTTENAAMMLLAIVGLLVCAVMYLEANIEEARDQIIAAIKESRGEKEREKR